MTTTAEVALVKNPALIAKRLLEATLVLLVIGVIGTTLNTVDFTSGGIHVAAPVRLAPSHQDLNVSSGLFGAGTIQEVSGFALFDSRLTSWASVLWIVDCLVNFVPAFWIVILLRRIASTVAAGDPFADANIDRMQGIGALVIGFWALYGAVSFALEMAVAEGSRVGGFKVVAAGGWNFYVLVIGVVVVGMAEVFRHGKRLQADADLTV